MLGCEGERNNCGGDNALCWSENNMLAAPVACACVKWNYVVVRVRVQQGLRVGYFEAVVRSAKKKSFSTSTPQRSTAGRGVTLVNMGPLLIKPRLMCVFV